ncbi:hypothetical protein chiPu_0024672, partial [Chiloscyllium punctatum]|nr:hypothetical protein [Chiloscyllium punctatum]
GAESRLGEREPREQSPVLGRESRGSRVPSWGERAAGAESRPGESRGDRVPSRGERAAGAESLPGERDPREQSPVSGRESRGSRVVVQIEGRDGAILHRSQNEQECRREELRARPDPGQRGSKIEGLLFLFLMTLNFAETSNNG